MSKYEDVSQDVKDMFEKVLEIFPDLQDAAFKLLFRNKRKGSGDEIVFAEVCRFSDLVKYLTIEDAKNEDGYDYCILIDKNVYEVLEEKDQWRILRHELRHCVAEYKEDGSVVYKLRKHTIEDFYEDVEIEGKVGGDPQWKNRIYEIGISLYDEIKEKEKAEKKANKKRK